MYLSIFLTQCARSMHDVAWHCDVNYVRSKDAHKQWARTSLKRTTAWKWEQWLAITQSKSSSKCCVRPENSLWDHVQESWTLTQFIKKVMFIAIERLWKLWSMSIKIYVCIPTRIFSWKRCSLVKASELVRSNWVGITRMASLFSLPLSLFLLLSLSGAFKNVCDVQENNTKDQTSGLN